MTVGQLKEILARVPDHLLVVDLMNTEEEEPGSMYFRECTGVHQERYVKVDKPEFECSGPVYKAISYFPLSVTHDESVQSIIAVRVL